jgi:hypothetical protein
LAVSTHNCFFIYSRDVWPWIRLKGKYFKDVYKNIWFSVKTL